MKILYIACPYTDDDPNIQLKRVALATKVAGIYVARGHIVYSPLTHTHLIDGTIPMLDKPTYDWWLKFNQPFMEICNEMIIIQTKGWDKSTGIAEERAYFKRANKPISFFLPEFIGE